MNFSRISLFILSVSIIFSACAQQKANEHVTPISSNSSKPPGPRVPAHYMSADEAKPISKVLDPANFTEPSIIKAYTYAREIPEIFAQQPCYCDCDLNSGHKSLLTCYETTHSRDCQICLMEGLYVKQLYNQGLSATQIRERIIQGDWKQVKL